MKEERKFLCGILERIGVVCVVSKEMHAVFTKLMYSLKCIHKHVGRSGGMHAPWKNN